MEMNPRNNVYYKANDSYELSVIQQIGPTEFKQEYSTDPYYDGILKCANTSLGRTIESYSKDENMISEVMSNLDMDFSFIKIGGADKINVSNMPPPPPPPTTTTTQPPPPLIPPEPNKPEFYGGYEYTYDDIINYLNKSILDIVNTNNQQPESFTNLEANEIIEKYNNTLQPRNNFNNYLFESRDGFEDYTEGFANCSVIDLTALNEFLEKKSVQLYESFSNNRDTIQGMISLFHYQYVSVINKSVIDEINKEIKHGRCNTNIGTSSTNSHCLISNYFMAETFNTKIKNFLEAYVKSVFNSKVKVNGEIKQNPFIDQLILNDSTYTTEPQGINNEMNNFINELVNNYGLNLNFVINLKLNTN
jgi:hypothetical protein